MSTEIGIMLAIASLYLVIMLGTITYYMISENKTTTKKYFLIFTIAFVVVEVVSPIIYNYTI